MISITPSKFTSLLGAVIISLLSACGGGAGEGGSSGFATSNTANTKPQTSTSSADITTSSSAKSSSSSSVSSSSTSKSSASAPSTIIDTTPPTIAPELTVTFTTYDLAVFSWAASTDNVGVTAYKIYRNQIQIDQIAATDLTYADFNVAPDSSYTYGVSAGDAVGNWSPVKTLIAKTQPQPVPPSSASSSSQNPTSSSSLSSSSSTSVANSSSAPASSYSSSSQNSLDATPPSEPGNLYEINISSAQIYIGWTAATDNVDVTTYRVYRDNVLLGTVDAGTLDYSDKTAAPNKTYTYGIEAGDAAGNWSLARKTISIATPASTNGDVTLYWAPPTQREDGSSITNVELSGFLIRYKSQTDTDYTYLDIRDSSAKSRIITNLTGSYMFQIAAYDSNNLYSSFVSLSPR